MNTTDIQYLLGRINIMEVSQATCREIPNYTQFESILIPGVGTTLYLNKPPSGVINVSRLSR